MESNIVGALIIRIIENDIGDETMDEVAENHSGILEHVFNEICGRHSFG